LTRPDWVVALRLMPVMPRDAKVRSSPASVMPCINPDFEVVPSCVGCVEDVVVVGI
jgi:hypothetical protein